MAVLQQNLAGDAPQRRYITPLFKKKSLLLGLLGIELN